jgi:hypothetical protein
MISKREDEKKRKKLMQKLANFLTAQIFDKALFKKFRPFQ